MNKSNTKRGEIGRFILGCAIGAGIVIVGTAMPNIFQVAKLFRKDRYPDKAIDQSLRSLMRKKLIKFVLTNNGWRLSLTRSGQDLLRELEIGEKIMKPRGRWDKKWRLLIFDIEEKRKHIRDMIRKTLKIFGFYRLQDSVWVYPYECEEILELLRTKYRVRHEALYLRSEYITNDKWLKRHFELTI